MPRSLHAQMTRSAISPRLAISIFLNRPDAKESFSVFHRLAVLNESGLDDARDFGLDLVHKLHRFDDTEHGSWCDLLADLYEGGGLGRDRLVEGADYGALRVDELRFRLGS